MNQGARQDQWLDVQAYTNSYCLSPSRCSIVLLTHNSSVQAVSCCMLCLSLATLNQVSGMNQLVECVYKHSGLFVGYVHV